jgi:hypothetical protein
MPPAHRYVTGWSPTWFLGEAGKISPAVTEAVQQIMARQEHVQQGFNAARGVLRFATVYSADRLDAACRRALHFNSISYRAIKTILEQRLDLQPWDGASTTGRPVVLHENLRGADYYQRKDHCDA